ncbi:MAG: glycosyltransferase family 39 protein [Elusimicrobia bacterium]|nr:glycosyltransferase family 39 protein [Elusimicrobiota bacterium]
MIIWILLLAASIVRVWGINFAFPLRYGHIDESVIIFYTMRFFTGDFNPNPFFDYPTLYLYLLSFCYYLYFIIGFIFGKFNSIASFIAFYDSNPVPFILIGRILTTIFSIATIYLTYLFAKKLFDKRAGLLAALFLSFSWQHILSSHYATTDITAAFFMLVTVVFTWDVYVKGDLKSYIFAGLFCGLSIAAKYYGGIVLLVIILYGWKNKKYLTISFLTTIAGFFAGCPYAFIDYAGFMERFFNRFNLIVGWDKLYLFSAFLNYPQILIGGLGYFLVIAIIIGFIVLLINRKKQDIFLLIILLVMLLFFGTWKQGAGGRYILALYPFFAIISAQIIGKIKDKTIFIIVILVFLITVIPKIVKTDILLSQKDTRVIAREWILKNIPAGARILRGPFCPEFPNDNYIVKIDWYDNIKNGSLKDIRKKYDYVVSSSLHDDPESFTGYLKKNGEVICEISEEAIGEFQNPIIKVYKLK